MPLHFRLRYYMYVSILFLGDCIVFIFFPSYSLSQPSHNFTDRNSRPGGPMIWTIAGELYPTRYRANSMALSTASNWFWNFMLAFFTPFIVGDIDFRYGYVFACCNLVGGAVVYFFVLEGQGRTLEEIDTMYVQKVLPWKSSKWVVPAIEEFARPSGEDVEKKVGPADERI